MDLSTVRNRDRLSARREPYWQKLGIGQFLGYRPASGKPGTWIARWYDDETRRQRYNALGDFTSSAPSERFGAAKKEAEHWFGHVSAGGVAEVVTVRDACARYAASRPDAQVRFERYVYGDPIARQPLAKLADRHVRDWRKRLEASPALVTRRKEGEPVTRPRAAATINRDMVPLRAALNDALDRSEVLSDHAWRTALRPIQRADRRRNLYLDRTQRRALLDELPGDVAAFVRGLCLLPLRPGALAALTVRDFDARRRELTIGHDKAGADRRILLPPDTADHLQGQARGKLPAAPLFARADGRAWDKDAWKKPIKEAALAASLPTEATAYTLRHSTITDLVQGGLDLLTVAQVAGTSVTMIERHYGHLQRERAAEALAGLVL